MTHSVFITGKVWTVNKVINLYRAFFSSREKDADEDAVRSLIKEIRNPSFDSDVIDQYIKDNQFVEQNIIHSILAVNHISLDVDYLSVYIRQMNVSAVTNQEDKAIIADELWSYTALSFFLTVFSLAYDNGRENFTRCIKNCFVMLDLQGQKHQIGIHNLKDIIQMISLPDNILNLAIDSYWTAWTFVIGHELYHLTSRNSISSVFQEELNADVYGYRILLSMIEAQKQKRIPKEIYVFYETYYLSPVMLFEYFRFLDLYRSMCSETVEYIHYPSPQQRQEQIFRLFDDCLPDTFDTEMGNEVLNHFLNAVDLLREQIVLKKERGKLEISEVGQ